MCAQCYALEGKKDVEKLIGALNHRSHDVREDAARALGNIGDLRAVDPLINALEDEVLRVRSAAMEALVQIGDPAVEALVQIGDPAVGLLIEALRNGIDESALVKICSRDPFILLPYLEQRSTVHIYRVLISCGRRETVSALVEALNKHGDVKMASHYLNCGNNSLENAARRWAKAHGYTVVTSHSDGAGPR